MTIRKTNRMDEAEIFRRAQEPGDRAAQRDQQARFFLKDLQSRDDEVAARMDKLKAMRLAAAPAIAAEAARTAATKATTSKSKAAKSPAAAKSPKAAKPSASAKTASAGR